MRNGKLGCAVWGCGWVASGHINAYLRNEHCELVALGSRRLESIQAKQAEFAITTVAYQDFQQLLQDERIDIVSICTPNDQHAAEAIQAAQAGKHVFLEKPVAIREEDFPRLQAAFQQSGTRSIVGLVLRFNPLVKLQKRLIAEGELGKVFLTNVDYWFGRERGGWMKKAEQTGGAFILAGCHSVDMARFVLGSDLVEVRGASAMVGDYYEYPSLETAQVRFANGALGVFTCSLEGCNPYTANLSILGEKGTIMNERFYLKRFAGQTEFFTLDTGVKKTGDVYGHPFPAMVEHFVECILEQKESPHNLESALNAHYACLAIQKSAAADGRRVEISKSGIFFRS
ncbi:MAG: Gfo/Idh/MocA family oxidoreductase [Lentisphaeria bacterium]